MKKPKTPKAPPPTPIPDVVQVEKTKRKDLARQLAQSGGRASTILSDVGAKLGA